MILRLADFRFPDAPERLYPENPNGDWVLEIGFGDGRFWAEHGPNEADANYLGVELSGVSLLKAQRRLTAAGLNNAHLTRLPASTLVRAVTGPGSLARIIVNFPDPWPKAGHEEHRLLRAPFFTLAASRLRPGGEVWFTTDHEEYFQFALQEAQKSGCFTATFPEPPAAALRTKYALKWRELGLSVHHVRWRAVQSPNVPVLPVEDSQGDHVPHAIVRLPEDFQLSNFRKTVDRTGEHVVVVLDAYRHASRDQWVLLTHVEERDLTQEALVSVTVREDGSALVRLERFGGPIITAGLKAAVGVVTTFLEERGASVTHRSY
ncbi:tRNA (guanine(46)-N(7))-methyltransferase TrmB [Deinococcus peraridilitoris]|uniref:tRNA (guanine-N(7)-)-methyltransferase n=1 Tax=Deinococcus peraridilitoris (strain DSM 19664 / LMG 22246 / CIP 109416 / KR-200) TaxID=937777 RepID=L0A1V3_DEIPD|nr:S-adenosylmethionine-dependent methyltransferase [Deinococcus peraridilitoris]AFZ67883.1 putative S-adenosylmethionine-dependent methyltransferase [Deinococcus peraridilitoris DSM 19664]